MTKVFSAHSKGTTSEFLSAAYHAELGYTVSFPFNDWAEYDYIIDKSGELKRVQVKTMYAHHETTSRYIVALADCKKKKRRGGYGNDSFDMLVALHPDKGFLYCIPRTALRHAHKISLYPESKKSPNAPLSSSDYEEYRVR